MSTPIDIYTYPENATPLELARYQVAVMEAAERGEPVEVSARPSGAWGESEHPQFTWEIKRYRIARPKLAEGHNPDKLTEAQVGVQDGWRLLTVKECRVGGEKPGVMHYSKSCKEWWHCSAIQVVHDEYTYRTKNPPGHYLPKPAAEPVAETRPGSVPVECPKFWFEPANETREETRRDRIATVVQLIRNGSETADQIAAKIDAMLAREQSAPGLTFSHARDIIGQ